MHRRIRKFNIWLSIGLYCVLVPTFFVSAQVNTRNLDEIRKEGFVYLRAGKWDLAQQTFENALNISPEDTLSLYGNSLALFNLKRYRESDDRLTLGIGLLSKSQENNGLLADYLVLSAVISAVENKNAAAIAKLEKAVNLNPKHFDANFSLGRAYFGNGEIDKSINSFQRAVEIRPDDAKSHFFLATALERSDKVPEALAEYRKVLELDPNSAEGNLGIGVLLIKTQGDRSAEGLRALQKAISVNEDLYEAQVTLGKTLIKLNRSAEAIGPLTKAAKLAPNNPEPHFQLSIAYRKLGKKVEAQTETETVKRIHANRRGISDPR